MKFKNKKLEHYAKISLVSLLLMGGLFIFWVSSIQMPDFDSFEQRKVASSTKILDRTGNVVLYDVHENIKRTAVPFDQINENVKKATIAIEDSEFYDHYGIKPSSIVRAVFVNTLSGKFSQGGSTITQQVVKNSLLTKDKKISRKIKEWILALRLDGAMSKDAILALYLNESPYGGSIYGVQEASRSFFGKDAKDLTLAESAYLAALPQAPTFYSPYGNNKQKLDERKNLVLRRMVDLKMIEESEYKNAVNEKVTFLSTGQSDAQAMHFIMYVREYLEEKYGKDAVESQGLKVTTSLDVTLQQKAEEIVKESALENEKKFNASNAGVVALDPKTGQILAMVGSRDYFDKNIDGNFNITLAHRQPGSSFKPIVYATAFNKGFTPNTVLFDLKTEFSTSCNADGYPTGGAKQEDCYHPENYDHKYRGPVSLREALAQSINVPAVKLLYLVGINDALKNASSMGIRSLGNKDQYGLTLVLGGGEVSLLDLTSAYGIFANNGIRNQSVSILKIEDINGNILEEFTPKQEEVLPKQVALQISDVLSDNNARSPAFGETSSLYINDNVAVKTGTTNDYRDAWILGYTPSVVVGAWAGNNNNTPMEKKVAGFIVAPMWNKIMREAIKVVPDEKFEQPDDIDESIKPVLRGFWQGNETYFVDKISGGLATEATPKETKEEKVIPNVHTILHWIDKNNPLGSSPNNPANDPQYMHWEIPIQRWLSQNGIPSGSIKPTSYDNVHTSDSKPKITISYPTDNSVFSPKDRIDIKVQNTGKYQLTKVDYFLNNGYIGSSTNNPFDFSFIPNELNQLKNLNELKAIGYDSAYNQGQTTVNIKLNI